MLLLGASTFCPAYVLVSLRLRGNPITDRGLAALAAGISAAVERAEATGKVDPSQDDCSCLSELLLQNCSLAPPPPSAPKQTEPGRTEGTVVALYCSVFLSWLARWSIFLLSLLWFQ